MTVLVVCDGCCNCGKRNRQLIRQAKTLGTVRVIQPGNTQYAQLVKQYGPPPFIIKDGARYELGD